MMDHGGINMVRWETGFQTHTFSKAVALLGSHHLMHVAHSDLVSYSGTLGEGAGEPWAKERACSGQEAGAGEACSG